MKLAQTSETKKERFKNPPVFLFETSLLAGGTEAEAESKLIFRFFVKKSSNINQKTPPCTIRYRAPPRTMWHRAVPDSLS